MRRSFLLDTTPYQVRITESPHPNTVVLGMGDISVELTRKQFGELADLATYSAYGDSIKWLEPKKPEQLELNLPLPSTPSPDLDLE